MNSVWKGDFFGKLWISASMLNFGGHIQKNVKPKNSLLRDVNSTSCPWSRRDQAWLVERIGSPSCFFSKPVMIQAKVTWKWSEKNEKKKLSKQYTVNASWICMFVNCKIRFEWQNKMVWFILNPKKTQQQQCSFDFPAALPEPGHCSSPGRRPHRGCLLKGGMIFCGKKNTENTTRFYVYIQLYIHTDIYISK